MLSAVKNTGCGPPASRAGAAVLGKGWFGSRGSACSALRVPTPGPGSGCTSGAVGAVASAAGGDAAGAPSSCRCDGGGGTGGADTFCPASTDGVLAGGSGAVAGGALGTGSPDGTARPAGTPGDSTVVAARGVGGSGPSRAGSTRKGGRLSP